MQYLILSDLHANWHALQAVLTDAAGEYESIVCCGDVVGYNPLPGAVIDWTRDSCAAVIRGNHDKVVAGVDSLEWFNEVAQIAARWTTSVLDEAQLAWLRELPSGPASIDGQFEICHGSLADEDEYVTSAEAAMPRFTEMALPVAFFGHTHIQGGFFSQFGRIGLLRQVRAKEREHVLELEPDVLYLVNPGSVGQPRDRDPRAAYAIYDTDRRLIFLRRVEYSVIETIKEIRGVGLPDVLGLRLLAGF